MKRELPVYKMLISENDNEETEVNYVALVDDPAIGKNFLKFERQLKFSVDKERRILSGPLMIADLPIYRRDEKMGEYYVIFDKDNIEKAVQKFFRKGYFDRVNIMHDEKKIVDGVYMFESFIVDEQRGILPPKGFEDLTNGSWFASYKVDNLPLWDRMQGFNGFSVEGLFGYELEMTEDEKTIKKIIREIEQNK